MRVLIAEDEPLARHLLRRTLEGTLVGFNIVGPALAEEPGRDNRARA